MALVGGAAEMASAFSGARKNRLDLSVGIALGSASQIALFVAPVLVLLSYVIGPTPMDLQFWPGAVVMMLIATFTAALVTNSGRVGVVRRGARPDGLPDLCHDALPVAAARTMIPSSPCHPRQGSDSRRASPRLSMAWELMFRLNAFSRGTGLSRRD